MAFSCTILISLLLIVSSVATTCTANYIYKVEFENVISPEEELQLTFLKLRHRLFTKTIGKGKTADLTVQMGTEWSKCLFICNVSVVNGDYLGWFTALATKTDEPPEDFQIPGERKFKWKVFRDRAELYNSEHYLNYKAPFITSEDQFDSLMEKWLPPHSTRD